MNLRSWLRTAGLRPMLSLGICLAMAQQALWADGVTRSLEPVSGGCKVTLAWDFAGKVESDLIIEERLAPGWSVNDATVPFGSLDATWFSGSIARFAVKPSLLKSPGSISFVVSTDAETASGTISGDWQMYLSGTLRKDAVVGQSALVASVDAVSSPRQGAEGDAEGTPRLQEEAVSIASFKVLAGPCIELSYASLAKAGTLVVEGCEGLGKPWTEVKRQDVPEGAGKVEVKQSEAGKCCFYRMKLLTKGE